MASRRTSLLLTAVVAMAVSAFIAQPAIAAPSPGPSVPTPPGAAAPTSSTVDPGGVSTVVASADWGTAGGKAWYRVNKGALIAAPTNASEVRTAPASTFCHEEISNVTLGGAGPAFRWSTEQICTGNFAPQSLKTQLWRSSWSGPRGYSAWSYTSLTWSTQLGPIYWSIICHVHAGYYDYYPVMQGTSSFGSGPVVRSANTLTQQPCGPNA